MWEEKTPPLECEFRWLEASKSLVVGGGVFHDVLLKVLVQPRVIMVQGPAVSVGKVIWALYPAVSVVLCPV